MEDLPPLVVRSVCLGRAQPHETTRRSVKYPETSYSSGFEKRNSLIASLHRECSPLGVCSSGVNCLANSTL